MGEEGDYRGWLASLNQLTESMDMSLSKLEVGDGQGGLACYSPWGRKELDTTERLNLTELKPFLRINKFLLFILVLPRNIIVHINIFIDIAVDDYQDVSSTDIVFKVTVDKIFFSLSLPKCLQTLSISTKCQNKN